MTEVKKGDLTKRGGGFPYKWQERTFILYDTKIDYFAGATQKGSVPLTPKSTVVSAESEKARAFLITTPGASDNHTLLMAGNSDSESTEWIAAIQGVIDKLAGKDPAPAAAEAPKEETKPAPKEEPKPVPKEEPKPKPAPKEEPKAKPAPKEEPKAKAKPKEEEGEPEVKPEDTADEIGLGPNTLMKTQGKAFSDKIPELVAKLKDDSVHRKTKRYLAEQWCTWCSVTAAGVKQKKVKEHYQALLNLIVDLSLQEKEDCDVESEGAYKGGPAHHAHKLAQGMGTASSMDTTQKLPATLAPAAWEALEKILDAELPINKQNAFVKENASTHRMATCQFLVRMMPHTGNVKVPNAMKVIHRVMLGDEYPDELKTYVSGQVNVMFNVNKACMKNVGPELMDIIAAGDNDGLITCFSTAPELYTNNPAAIHKQLDVICEIDYRMVVSLLVNIAQKNPKQLTDRTKFFVDKLEEETQFGAMTLMILKELAGVAPNDVYPHMDRIEECAADVSHAGPMLSGVIANCGHASKPKGAADAVLLRLVKGLEECPEKSFAAGWIQGINNLTHDLSSHTLLQPHLPLIRKYKDVSDILVTAIEDCAAGRSLAKVSKKVDELDAKVNALNERVAESCKSYEDVIAYVDKNIRDVKDFVGEVVKKLPLPKRLEVVGTMRKTLILHFECCRTGREYPIQSKEWNKWLKMGFSLAKSGKALIDVGTGNPLGLLTTGVDCVKGIYEAYKSNDDDEFNTYISNPFLTSTEQDGLIEKLRDQEFFDKFSYDAQKGGWYLNNPEEDGFEPGGDAGSVTKVKSKKGVGVTESIMAAAEVIGNEVSPDMMDALGTAGDVATAAGQVKEMAGDAKRSAEEVAPKGCCTIS